ncbi:STAS domain-containing protein [Candidatus Peregrinibacteria bacterium]|nr:STAS domain-containing protein [Candidatus Peregrinibacteria bacterium]
MQKLTITIENLSDIENAHLVRFEGDFDGYAKENLVDIQKYVDESTPNAILVFDFNKLNYLNSYAIGHLVAWHNHLARLGGKIIMVGTNKNVEDIFAILGIGALFKIYPDMDTAVKALKEEGK